MPPLKGLETECLRGAEAPLFHVNAGLCGGRAFSSRGVAAARYGCPHRRCGDCGEQQVPRRACARFGM